jgi:hypothetical protein
MFFSSATQPSHGPIILVTSPHPYSYHSFTSSRSGRLYATPTGHTAYLLTYLEKAYSVPVPVTLSYLIAIALLIFISTS